MRARAGLDFDLYLATKHYGVHLLYRLGLSKRAIAAQVGWSEDAVDGLLRTYGHLDLIAPAEVDALYQTQAQMQPDPARSLSGIRPIPVVVRLEVAQELERFGRPHGGTG